MMVITLTSFVQKSRTCSAIRLKPLSTDSPSTVTDIVGRIIYGRGGEIERRVE